MNNPLTPKETALRYLADPTNPKWRDLVDNRLVIDPEDPVEKQLPRLPKPEDPNDAVAIHCRECCPR